MALFQRSSVHSFGFIFHRLVCAFCHVVCLFFRVLDSHYIIRTHFQFVKHVHLFRIFVSSLIRIYSSACGIHMLPLYPLLVRSFVWVSFCPVSIQRNYFLFSSIFHWYNARAHGVCSFSSCFGAMACSACAILSKHVAGRSNESSKIGKINFWIECKVVLGMYLCSSTGQSMCMLYARQTEKRIRTKMEFHRIGWNVPLYFCQYGYTSSHIHRERERDSLNSESLNEENAKMNHTRDPSKQTHYEDYMSFSS